MQRAPRFAEACGRLAFLRAFSRFYEPFTDRAASADLVTRESERALALDPQNVDALLAQLFLVPPFGKFGDDVVALVERIRRVPSIGEARGYVGWYVRNLGWVRDSLENRNAPIDWMC